MDKIKEIQSKIIDSIQGQDIKLIKNSFIADENISGLIDNESIEISLNIEIKEIGKGNSENSSGKKEIIFAIYSFNLNYSLKNNTKPFIKIKSLYKLIIFLKNKIDFFDNEESEAKNINIFFNSTGRVMVYPYFRHTSDFLIRESSFILPPLPPLKI